MKTKKLLKPLLTRETLVRLEDMAQVNGGVRLYEGPQAHLEATRPCIISRHC
jgi:hypothetical protein